MYKLTVVGGPQRGTVYKVDNGNATIGRIPGNDIVLQSNQVSKRHCVLVVDNTGVTVNDAGSSNGTFVNGVLSKSKHLNPGDRISVGEYILELTKIESSSAAYSNVVPFPTPMQSSAPAFIQSTQQQSQDLFISGAPVEAKSAAIQASVADAAAAVPTGKEAEAKSRSLVEKIKFNFDKYVINFLYNLNERHEWKIIIAGIFTAAVAFSVFITVYVVSTRTDLKLQVEARHRAALLAREIVDRNTPYLLERMETKTDVAFVEKENGVAAAFLVDMEGRILAPGRKLNQYITEDKFYAAFAAAARKFYQDTERSGAYFELNGEIIGVAEPVRILNPSLNKNVSVALGLVFFDQSTVTFDSGTEYMMFINAAVLAAIFGLAAFVSIYRVSVRPIQQVNDEVDLVLKNSGSVVTKKFKMAEMDSLIDVINAALQRTGGGAGNAFAPGAAGDGASMDSIVECMKSVGSLMREAGVMVFSQDKRILFINGFMEEATGIRTDSSAGADLETVSRDAALTAFIQDLLNRSQPGTTGAVKESFELSGSNYQMECVALGFEGSMPKGYVLLAEKEGSA